MSLEKLWDEFEKHQWVKGGGGACSCGASSYPCRWRADLRDAMVAKGVDPLVDKRPEPEPEPAPQPAPTAKGT